MNAAREQAFDCVFPNLGPWGNPRAPKCPPAPLTGYLAMQQRLAKVRVIPDYDEQGHVIPPPPRPPLPSFEEVQAAAAAQAAETHRREAKLRAYRESLRVARDASEYLDPLDPDEDSPLVGGVSDADSTCHPPEPNRILSPKIDVATKSPSPYVRLESPTYEATEVRQTLASFRHRQQAKKERATAKRLKAAKRHARRRAA